MVRFTAWIYIVPLNFLVQTGSETPPSYQGTLGEPQMI